MSYELVTQSCLTLCDPMNCSPPGSSVRGIFQGRVLEWDAIAFSVVKDRRGKKDKCQAQERCVKKYETDQSRAYTADAFWIETPLMLLIVF